MHVVQNIGNTWVVVRLNSEEEVVSVINSFKRQQDAVNCLMNLYQEGLQ